jgi:hypothetical protein
MAEIMVTSTADSGAGSLRQAIADAADGDVILFDADVFPVGETTSILLSSYISVSKSVSIYGGFNDGAGGYTSGATKRFYVYREVEGVKTKTYIDDETPAQDGETVLFENVCRVALDGQETAQALKLQAITGNGINIAGVNIVNGKAADGGAISLSGSVVNNIFDCTFDSCTATTSGGGIEDFYQDYLRKYKKSKTVATGFNFSLDEVNKMVVFYDETEDIDYFGP